MADGYDVLEFGFENTVARMLVLDRCLGFAFATSVVNEVAIGGASTHL